MIAFLWSVWSVVAAAGIGWIVLPGVRLRNQSALPRWALRHLAGAAAISLAGTALAAAGCLALAPIYAAALIGVAWRFRHRHTESDRPTLPPRCPLTWVEVLLATGILMAVVAAALHAHRTGLGWDGWVTWQLKAKALWTDSSWRLLTVAEAAPYAHLDYPPLTPMASWWAMAHARSGGEAPAQIAGFAFYVDAIALAAGVIAARSGRRAALIAALLVAAYPGCARHAASGYADMALAAAVLGAVIAGANRQPWALGWMVAALVQTKAEGVAPAVGLLIAAAVGRERRAVSAAMLGAAAGWLPWLLVRHAAGLASSGPGGVPYPLAGLQGFQPAEPGNILRAIRAMAVAAQRHLSDPWGGALLWLAPLAGLVGTTRHHGTLCRWVASACGCHLIAYVAFICLSADPPEWLGATTFSRVLLQIWPCAAVFAAAAAPGAGAQETAMARRSR